MKNNNMYCDTQNRTPTFDTNKYTKTFVAKSEYYYLMNKRKEIKDREETE